MNGLHAYLKLTEHGRPCDTQTAPTDPRGALVDLLEYAAAGGRLEAASAWRLAPGESRALEERAGYSPPGGWAGLTALAAGCDVLSATHDGFEPDCTPEAIMEPSAEEWRRQLTEAFTARLVPPGAAAGLFVMLGLHPMWGLRLAEESGAPTRASWRDETIFPPTSLKTVQTAAFGALAAVMATLRALDPDLEYPLDALPDVVLAACETSRHMAEMTEETAPDGALPVFVAGVAAESSMRRVRDLTIYDLVDSVLVPAGVLRRSDSGMFTVVTDSLEGVVVGEMTPEEQETWLGWLTATEPRFLVA